LRLQCSHNDPEGLAWLLLWQHLSFPQSWRAVAHGHAAVVHCSTFSPMQSYCGSKELTSPNALPLVYTLSKDSCLRVLGSSLDALQRVFCQADAVECALQDLVPPSDLPLSTINTNGHLSAEAADLTATAANELKGRGSPTAPYTFESSLETVRTETSQY
jgi:hypothetical protein